MFGIGLPEMIVIFVVALLVVGPDKLPDLARSLAKGLFELKKTLNEVKGSFAEEERAVREVKDDLKNTASALREQVMLDEPPRPWEEQTAANAGEASANTAKSGQAETAEDPEAAADREEIQARQAETLTLTKADKDKTASAPPSAQKETQAH